jgi:hypothetical protein
MGTYDLDRLQHDWDHGHDPERAVAETRRFFEDVTLDVEDPVGERCRLYTYMEPQFDGPGGSPAIVLAALRHAEPLFRSAEADAHGELRIDLRCGHGVAMARALHRAESTEPAGRWNGALVRAHTALFELEKAAESKRAIRDALASPDPNVVAEHAVGIAGILPAAMRRTAMPPDARQLLVAECRTLVGAYALSGHAATPYPRTYALANQNFFLLCEIGDPEDLPIIDVLYDLDVQYRPLNARSQATTALRDFEYALVRGDQDAARTHAERAIRDLTAFGLERHLRVLVQRGYLQRVEPSTDPS